MRGLKLLTLLGCGTALWCGTSAVVYGQVGLPAKDAPPTTFSMNVRDSPVRAALTELFEAAHVQYSIDQKVNGFETLHITDQGFEPALRVLLRSSSQPLSYTKENGVYYIKPRAIVADIPEAPPAQVTAAAPSADPSRVDILTLAHTDPYDLASVLGIKILPFGTRFTGMASGGGGAANGLAPGSAGAGKNGSGGPPSGASGISGSGVINGGTLISNDEDNDILRIGD